MNSIRWDDAGNRVADGNAQPRSESLWPININRWRITVPIGTHQTQEARKAKGMIPMSVRDEYLGDFAWLDASCSLDLELIKTIEVIEER